MIIEDEFQIESSPEHVFTKLTDITSVIECIPNVSRYEITSKDEFIITFKVDLSRILGKLSIGYLSQLTVKMKFKFEYPGDNEVYLNGVGRGAGVNIKVRIFFKVLPLNNNSKVIYRAELEAGLLERIFGEMILKEIADGVADELITCIRNKLAR